MTVDAVDFYADPCCPWTWNTSRWLVEVAEALDVSITWRTLCLAELNRDADVPAHFRPRLACSRRMARSFEALHASDRNDDHARLFAAYGAHVHLDEHEPSDDLIASSAREAGLDTDEILGFAADASWDDAITASVERAMALAGPDVGSPILAVPSLGRGFMGPIVSPPPTGEAAVTLWRVVEASFEVPVFFELKRGRRDAVAFGPRR